MKWMERAAFALIVIIFAGLFIHAPFTVFFGRIFPEYALEIKAWKEILLVGLGLLTAIMVWQRKQYSLFRDKLLIAMTGLIVLHVCMVVFSLIQGLGAQQIIAGIMIDIRYLVFFVLVYVWCIIQPNWRNTFFVVLVSGAAFMLSFSFMQIFFLPHDVLSHLGYNVNTIAPYLTVDQNYEFIRIISTMRGPNSLGAAAAAVLIITLVYIMVSFKVQGVKKILQNRLGVMSLVFFVLSALAIWFSYSRSALLAAGLAGIFVVVFLFRKAFNWKLVTGIFVGIFALVGGFLAMGYGDAVSNILLHEDPESSSVAKSNDGHAASLADGVSRMLQQPFGAGIGSTGSASLLGDESRHFIVENHYLFVAHEIGWAGLILYILCIVIMMKRLWKMRHEWLSFALFVVLLAMGIIAMFLPVFADDSVAMLVFGLVAVVLGREKISQKHKARAV